jgi:Ca2+-binding RTX toxin-like protein
MTRFVGGAGADEYIGNPEEADVLSGRGGDDWLYGRGGNDQIAGGADNDVLFGDDGSDTISGGDGDDLIYTGSGVPGSWEAADGGAGNDRIFLAAGYIDDGILYDAGNVRAFGGPGADEIHGGMGENELHGGIGDDYLAAEGGYLEGGAGDDVLYGGGNTELVGGRGDDQLHAYLQPLAVSEPATAVLNGGAGADVFGVRAVNDDYQSVAYVADFSPDQGDRLAFDAFVMRGEAGDSTLYTPREVFTAFDTGADGFSPDGWLDFADTASGAVSQAEDGSISVSLFGDLLVVAGHTAVADWMLA